jgi:hypothetical protein
MGAPTYTLPTNNADTATEEPKITLALSELKSLLTAGLTAANVQPASLTDASLASPTSPAYRTLVAVSAIANPDLISNGSNIYFVAPSPAGNLIGSGTAISGLASNSRSDGLPLIYFDDADYTVASKTIKLRLRAQVTANATAPACNFTFGLYPITVAGGADAITFTAGTVVSSSTVAISTPSASTVTSGVNSDFTAPADGAYAVGVVLSTTQANNSIVQLSAQLQVRNV